MDIRTEKTYAATSLYDTTKAKKSSPADELFAAAAAGTMMSKLKFRQRGC